MSLKQDFSAAQNAVTRGENMHDILNALHQSANFSLYTTQHPDAFLSHFFCQLSPALLRISPWEVGYYCPKTKKMTIFSDGKQKPDDDVFRKPGTTIEQLNIQDITITQDQAFDFWRTAKYFSAEQFGNGFIVLQQLSVPTWSITFMTKSIRFANLKVNATDGTEVSHDIINLVEKMPGEK